MYVISTLTAANTYAVSEKFPEGITIKGGANLADARTIVTPLGGVVTKVSDDQVEALNDDPTFKLHKENGFLTLSRSRPDPEAAVGADDLNSRDKSAPLTPQDVAAEGAQLHETSAPTDAAPAAPEPPRNSRRA